MAAKADRLVERARLVADAVDDRLAAAFLMEAAECERADGGAEAAAAELGARPDWLEQPDAIFVIGPDQHIRGEASVRRLDDAVERAAVRPLGHDVAVARLGDAGRHPDVAVDRNALGEVLRLDRAVPEAVR